VDIGYRREMLLRLVGLGLRSGRYRHRCIRGLRQSKKCRLKIISRRSRRKCKYLYRERLTPLDIRGWHRWSRLRLRLLPIFRWRRALSSSKI